MEQLRSVEIKWESVWRVVFVLALVFVLYRLQEVLVVFFLSIVISSALDAPISYLEKRRIPRIVSLLLIFIMTVAVFAVLLYTIVPISIIEFKDFFSRIDEIETALGGVLGISAITSEIQETLNRYVDALFSGDFSVVNFMPKIFTNAVLFVVTMVASFYLALNRDGVGLFLRAVLPLSQEEYAINLFRRVRRKIGQWFKGQMILSFLVGLVTYFGLLILGVPYALVLGIIAGFLEIIPFAGPLVAGLFAFLAGASESFTLGIYVILLFIVIQQLESHLVVPLVMKKVIGIHPVAVIFAILAGSQAAGFIGVILAVPTLVLIQEVIEDWGARKEQMRSRSLAF